VRWAPRAPAPARAAFLIGGLPGTFIGWRPVFGLPIVVSAIVFVLSFRLKPDEPRTDVGIDLVGVVLAAASVILITLGFNRCSSRRCWS
jgi:hypothetical protein